MEVTGGSEEGFIREWTPCSHILNLIPPRVQNGLFSSELCLTCVDAVPEYVALGTNVGLVYWYDRKKGNIQRLRCETSSSAITFVKIVSTVDFMVGAGNAAGQVTVFQIPKEHPENIPDNFKPKVEPKVERYTIGDLHKGAITAIEWSKNGMRLFSGDKNGVIIMTEIDFYMHLCKSMEIVNEQHEIVQISYHQSALLVSSVYRSILCERRDARWHVTQLGKRERKSLCPLGAVFQHSYATGAVAAYCARPGLRLWRAGADGAVLQTLLFKDAIANPLTEVELLNPARAAAEAPALGPLYVFRDHFLVSHGARALYVLDPRTLTVAAALLTLRRIVSLAVCKDEIWVVEGARSLLRLAAAPEPAAPAAEEPLSLMTKSLSSSLQHAVNTVRDLTQSLDPLAPLFEPAPVAEECFELPPVRRLPPGLDGDVLESIVNEFKVEQDVSFDIEASQRAKSEEIQRKLQLYNSIIERHDDQLVHSSRRRRDTSKTRRDMSATRRDPSTTRSDTAALADGTYTSPCVIDVSVYGTLPPPTDELLEQQIEEKEKMLAKMLNLETLSISAPAPASPEPPPFPRPFYFPPTVDNEIINNDDFKIKTKKRPEPADLVPKVVQLPNNWNLNLELHLDSKGHNKTLLSPDEHLDSEWEII